VDVDRLGGADARVSAATIEPFGSTEPTGTPSTNAIHFTGRENDGTILHYSRARHYDPVRSRFVSEDPLGYKGGLNVYRYGADNPLRFVDPKGLTKIDVDIRARKMTVDPEVPGRPPYSVPVTSGHGECMNSPPCGNRPWDGPIPGGGYTIDTTQVSDPGTVGDILRNILGDWGDWRVPLVPNPGTNTFGRGGATGRVPLCRGEKCRRTVRLPGALPQFAIPAFVAVRLRNRSRCARVHQSHLLECGGTEPRVTPRRIPAFIASEGTAHRMTSDGA
jgi:RHS repeat-associated protein